MRKQSGTEIAVEKAELIKQRNNLIEVIEKYNPKDLFNFNETELFYKLRPD